MILLVWIGSKQREISLEFSKNQEKMRNKTKLIVFSPLKISICLSILIFLIFTKNFYSEVFDLFIHFIL